MNKFFGHLKTITHHKNLVRKTCFKAGMYKQGMLHDMSKYSPIEFLAGVKYYQGGERSPINREKEENGMSYGWLHHKGRNRHHFEYWIDYSAKPQDGLKGMKMPKRYVAEMVIDRISASKNYSKDAYTDSHPVQYWERGKKIYVIHKDSAMLTDYLFNILETKGENELCKYIKLTLLKNKKGNYHFENGKLILD